MKPVQELQEKKEHDSPAQPSSSWLASAFEISTLQSSASQQRLNEAVETRRVKNIAKYFFNCQN